MSGGIRRGIADLSCRALQATLPPSLKPWGRAVRIETAGIADDSEALLFALGSMSGLMPRAVAFHLLRPFDSLTAGGTSFSGGSAITSLLDATMRRPRELGVACAIGAVALGLAYMAIAGAPLRYLGINLGAAIIGLIALTLRGHIMAKGRRWAGTAMVAMAVALLATALLGDRVEGTARWITLGGLSIQPSLVLLPLMLVGYARVRNAVTTLAVVAAAAAVALQPDRAMAGMLTGCLIALAALRPDRHVAAALTAGIIGLAVTLAQADTLPAARYVDQILYSAFDVHPAAGVAVLGGAVLLLVPSIVGWWRDPAHRPTYAAFGAVWCAAIVAAALGNYPTPVVGYGGSAVIGYLVSLLALPSLVGTYVRPAASDERRSDTMPCDPRLLFVLA